MKKFVYVLFFLLVATAAQSAENPRSIKILVENPTNVARPAADIVLSIPDLQKAAPDFKAGAVLITCTSAATLEQDASAQDSTELPAQVDDLDGDNEADELAFQIDLAPHQSRIVTILYGHPDQILRLRQQYPQRTSALFSTKIEGLGWESENIAFRVYFDPRSDIDIYGKRHHSLQLALYATPDYPYHEESPEGRDIYKVGEASGIGAVAAWVDGKLVKAADVKDRKWRIISLGPVRTIVELNYNGWNLGKKSITLQSRITMWAGEHGFTQTIKTDPESSTEFVTGLPVKKGLPILKSIPTAPHEIAWLATWGEQVVAPGATATEAIAGQNLGLAVLSQNYPISFVEAYPNYLLKFVPQEGTASWYALAAWDQENTEPDRSSATGPVNPSHPVGVGMPESFTTKGDFLALVEDQALRMSQPVKVRILLGSAHN